ncbi:hypothetical protein FQN57_007018 [Myotisia sp. PD_48]|nr:hypothetical protein FQN57_007018 [Myotisia sp. PD_48]
MVKSYLKFEPSRTFGLVTSAISNVTWLKDEKSSNSSRKTGAGRAVVGAGEQVICWDIKKGDVLSKWRDSECDAQVTAIAQSKADADLFAVGYEDGTIRVWDSRLSTVMISFNGHKTAVTQLAFDAQGARLASGSKDTDIILWDLVSEVGLVKLRGHTDQITSLHFLTGIGSDETQMETDHHDGFLLSTGKDSLIKIWDISSHHCIETHIAQGNGECWSLGLSPDQSGCITGGNEGELRIWSIDTNAMVELSKEKATTNGRAILTDRGNLYRNGKDRTIGIHFHPTLDYIALHGPEKSTEIWRIKGEEEIQKSLARKRKRRREKAREKGTEEDQDVDMADSASTIPISEVFVPHTIVRTGGKVRSVAWMGSKGLQLLVATANNQLETYGITPADKKKHQQSDESDYMRNLSVEIPGHRTDVRSLALSSDDRMVSSASNGSLKIWNARTDTCLRTLDCGYALCSAFLPGDKIVVVGNKNGEIEVFDIASSSLLDTIQAHDGPIWALQVHPDGKSMVTGSADKTAKFWEFKIVQEEILGTKRTTPKLKLVNTRTLKVADDILSLRFSPDARLLAVSLLDNTIKVFFVDTLKLFLNLYGHKLPVLNMDISYDSKMIVTCSADKTVRLWGLDFGDCHKSFFAHQDSVMAVAFIPHNKEGDGHNFFSISKDRTIKYWDGDKFQQVQKLNGHHGEIWALAMSRSGEFVVTASHDKSIRIWEQTDEQIFLEEEREKEMEELYEDNLLTSLDQEEGDDKPEAVAAGKQTAETLTAGEKIIEALDLGMDDLALIREYEEKKAKFPNTAPPTRHPQYLALGNISAERYLLNIVRKVPAASLQDALLVLPFSKLSALFTFINIWAGKGWDIPLTCRVLFFILKTHHTQIVTSKMMKPMLDAIRDRLRHVLERQKDEMGYNLAALQFIGGQVREKTRSNYIDEDLWEEEERKQTGAKKRQFMSVS